MTNLTAAPAANDSRAEEIAVEAYLYLYPLVMMDITRRQMTNIEAGERPGVRADERVQPHAGRSRRRTFKAVVRPNFDTLYSLGVARPDRRADDRLGAGHRRALLPAADAGHVDGRLRRARQAHQRHRRRPLRRRAARLARRAAGRRRRIDAPTPVRLDHRPHADQRPRGLRRPCTRSRTATPSRPLSPLGQGAAAGRRSRSTRAST